MYSYVFPNNTHIYNYIYMDRDGHNEIITQRQYQPVSIGILRIDVSLNVKTNKYNHVSLALSHLDYVRYVIAFQTAIPILT